MQAASLTEEPHGAHGAAPYFPFGECVINHFDSKTAERLTFSKVVNPEVVIISVSYIARRRNPRSLLGSSSGWENKQPQSEHQGSFSAYLRVIMSRLEALVTMRVGYIVC